MTPTEIERIWNRAAMEHGGSSPQIGDLALTSLLQFHNMAMNGGIEHAFDVLDKDELEKAFNGFNYFGFIRVADLIREAENADEDTLDNLDKEYGNLIPTDNEIVKAFESKLASSPEAFSL